MAVSAASLLVDCYAPGTQSGYKTGANKYAAFCRQFHPQHIVDWSPSGDFLLAFLTFHAGLKTSYESIKQYISAIRYYNTVLGDRQPLRLADPRISLAMRAVRKQNRVLHPLVRLPITSPMLVELLSDSAGPTNVCFAAGACLGVRGLLRGGEYTVKDVGSRVLRRRDVTFIGDDKMEIFLSGSKTDQFGTGVVIKLFRDAAGSTICPWSRVKAALDAAKFKDGDSPLLQNKNGSPYKYTTLLSTLKSKVKKLGYDGKVFGSHSFRIGGATDLARLKFPAHVIRARGRWTSDAFMLYTRTHDDDLRRAQAAQLSLPPKKAGKGALVEALGGFPLPLAYALDFENLDMAVSFFRTGAASA